jgi:hypothetical protein
MKRVGGLTTKSKSLAQIRNRKNPLALKATDTNQLLAMSVYDPSNLKSAIQNKIKLHSPKPTKEIETK